MLINEAIAKNSVSLDDKERMHLGLMCGIKQNIRRKMARLVN